MDFFDFSKDFKRGPSTSKGCITGDPKILALDSEDSKPIKREIIGTDYVNEIVEQEKKLMNNVSMQEIHNTKLLFLCIGEVFFFCNLSCVIMFVLFLFTVARWTKRL